MPEKPPTKAEKRQTSRMQQSLKRVALEQDKRNKRRLLLGGLLGVSAITLTSAAYFTADALQSPRIPTLPDVIPSFQLTKTPSISYNNIRSANLPMDSNKNPEADLDRQYLLEILQSAPESSSNNTPNVSNNLSLVRTRIEGGFFSTNAYMLDASGIYLTCGHTFVSLESDETNSDKENPTLKFHPKNLPASVVNPYLMKRYPVRAYIADPVLDLAVFFAPTGFRRSKTAGLSLETTDLEVGSDLWQPALRTVEGRINLTVLYGKVDQNPEIDLFNTKSTYKNRVGVTGMIPFGGSSGTPLITRDRKIFAVESGFFVKPNVDLSKILSTDDYAGSLVSPVKNLLNLAKTGEIIQLPQ